jgi:hypothetical protein
MASNFTLRLITQRAAGGDPIIRERQVEGPTVSIGRSVENDVVLADLSVDPRHAQIMAVAPGRVRVETVGGLPFIANGKSDQRVELDLASKPQLAFGDYTLALEPAPDGDVAVIVTRVEAEHAPEPSIFSLKAKLLGRRRLAWTLGLGVLALCLIIPVFFSDLFQGQKIRPDQQWSSGPLSQAHAFLEKDCNACHQKAFVAVRDQACLSCHGKAAPGGQLAVDRRVRELGSPFRPIPVAEHGVAGFSAAEMHKRLIRGEPPTGDWLNRVQAVFNHPTDRCASCHVEHTHATGGAQASAKAPAPPRQEKPTLIVVRDCQACHSQLKMRLKDTTLIDTPNWEKHPRFRPQVTRGGRDAPGPRLWLTSNPREETGLIFPHDTHLNPLGGPARQAIGLGRTHPDAGPVTCTSCHERQGEGFRPVEMERDCEACHSLAFANRGGALVKLPHEEPAKVMAFLTNFYGGGGAAAGVYRAAFSPGGACVDCHTISWRGAEAVVAPVHLSQSFMPRSGFNHAIEQHGAKSVDEKVCRDCHRSAALKANPAAVAAQPWRVSTEASDLMMPDKADCASCHGNSKAAKADSAPADCKTCHSFHTPGQATCEPSERPIAVRSWTANEPPKCLAHPRRYATATPPKS